MKIITWLGDKLFGGVRPSPIDLAPQPAVFNVQFSGLALEQLERLEKAYGTDGLEVLARALTLLELAKRYEQADGNVLMADRHGMLLSVDLHKTGAVYTQQDAYSGAQP